MAYNRLKANVKQINWALTRNRMSKASTLTADDGETTSVPMLAEDLSNLVDVGTYVADLDADQLKNFMKDVAMGIGSIVLINEVYKADTYGIVKDEDSYEGALERICISSLPEAQESHQRSLRNGVNYLDGKYYGMELSSKVFSDEFDWKIPYSIGERTIGASFTDPVWINRTIREFEVAVANSIELKTKAIADTLINKAIVDDIANNKYIKLVTSYNSFMGYVDDEALTWANIRADREELTKFRAFVSLVLKEIKLAFAKLTQKYNDGTVPMFTKAERIKLVGLTEFTSVLTIDGFKNLSEGSDILPSNIHETLSWQNDGAGLLPMLSMDGGTADSILDGVVTYGDVADVNAGSPKSQTGDTLNNVVMFMYDSDMMGVNAFPTDVTTEYVGSEGFYTYFNHFAIRQYLDRRGNSIAFTLD